MEKFQNKISIVTGGNSGIGFALSKQLLKLGGTVYVLGHNEDHVNEAILKLKEISPNVYPAVADVTNKNELESRINEIAEKEGQLDYMFNNAGMLTGGDTLKKTEEDWEKMMNLNVWSVIHGSMAALSIMLKQGNGHIVNTSSIAGLIPVPFAVLYSTTKFAVVGFSESLRLEYADKGVNVSVLCPGWADTSLLKKDMGKVSDNIDSGVEKSIKSRKVISPDDLAEKALKQISKNKDIIIIPSHPYSDGWRLFALGNTKIRTELAKYM